MLQRYLSIVEGRARPAYRIARDAHDPADPGRSLLDAKIARAREVMSSCMLCGRRCGADRLAGETGTCGVGAASRVASEFIHMGEEPELVPSHTIFFAGCTMRCVYCQNWDLAMDASAGLPTDPVALARNVEERHGEGARNVNVVGGDPTPNILTILEMLAALEVDEPLVFNTNMYLSDETLDILEGVVDVYLADFRYGSDACARRYSGVDHYWATVTRAFERAADHAEIMLRHLVLPGHLECCTGPIMAWVSEHLPGVYFNLMFQYRPDYRASQYPEMDRRLTPAERERALDLARRHGIALGG
jgi:putative pyruvate formate lyase activating enzyme